MVALTNQIDDLCHSVRGTRENIIQQHPTWNVTTDTRLGFFSRYVNILESTRLAIFFQEKDLMSRRWWLRNISGSTKLSDEDISLFIEEFNRSTRIGFLQTQFSAIETSFRLFVKAIDPTACSNGIANFATIYAWLFKRLGLQGRNFEELLDLLRETRNTLHNNGVYFPSNPNKQNISVPYKGKMYSFDAGKGITFGTWIFYFSLIPDITQMLVDVVESKEVLSIPNIDDSFSLTFSNQSVFHPKPLKYISSHDSPAFRRE